MTVLIFILVLSVLVFAHELGHFWTARKLGVKAEEFGFGFPPRVIGVYKDKNGQRCYIWGNKPLEELSPDKQPRGTVYSLNWLPIGGFVKIKGENGDNKQEKDSFASQSLGKRALILAAGVIMNIILAFFLLSIGYMIGLPKSLDKVGSSAHISEAQVIVVDILDNSPAAQAGLKSKDIILAVDGQTISNSEMLQSLIQERNGLATNFLIKSGEEEKNLMITPEIIADTNKPGIGVSIYTVGKVRYPFFLAIWEGLKSTVLIFWAIIVAFFVLVRDLLIGSSVSVEVAGPVGIATLTSQATRLGFSYLLQFTSLLSLNLAFINIFPFPALDGGRLLFLLIEKIKGKPVKQSVEAWIHAIGFWILITLMIVVTYKDIVNFLN